jgi:two-component system, NtrC family, sensor kinase
MAALGKLVASIAHEINTPIGAVQSSINNLDHALRTILQELPTFFQVDVRGAAAGFFRPAPHGAP